MTLCYGFSIIILDLKWILYDANRELLGIVAADIHLLKLSQFLRDLNISRDGQVFVVEKDGRLIANSSSHDPFKTANDEISRVRAIDSPDPLVQGIAQAPEDLQIEVENAELDFVQEDLPKVVASMKMGTERIREIVLSLRNFSRMDEAEMKAVDIYEGIESTLTILQNRLKARAERPEIEIVREYADLPAIECYAGQLNQAFMNILSNAIDALEAMNASSKFAEIATKSKFQSVRAPLIRCLSRQTQI